MLILLPRTSPWHTCQVCAYTRFLLSAIRKQKLMMFKYPEDRLPVAIILVISCIDFCLYFLINNLWVFAIYWAVMIVPKGKICAWNHHHQHTHTFRNTALNRVLEFFYALHSGVTTNLWLLHHVLGHHVNYMDQRKDEGSTLLWLAPGSFIGGAWSRVRPSGAWACAGVPCEFPAGRPCSK